MIRSKQKPKLNTKRNRKRKLQTRRVKGGKPPLDRTQFTDFIFLKSNLNPSSSYEHYILVNQPPSYLNIFDNMAYQFEGIEEELQAYSKNKYVIPAYKYRINVASTHARTQAQHELETARLQKKIERSEAKTNKLKELQDIAPPPSAATAIAPAK